MNDKKNIDRLFQERFKDFEAVPNDKIWNNIHTSLHDKKKKKVMPVWWKLSGIAAGLVLAFFTFTTFFTSEITIPTVVVGPKTESEETKLPLESVTKTAVATETTSKVADENSSAESNQENFENPSATNPKNTATTTILKKTAKNTGIAEISLQQVNTTSSQNTFVEYEKNIDKKTDDVLKTVSPLNFYNRQFASRENNKAKRIYNYLNSNQTKIDSTALAITTTSNTIEAFLQEQQENKNALAEVKTNKWQVSTNVAPVYFNSASNGSPIEAQFAENSKTYENNLSIGVGVQYAVNKKLAVRTGFNKVTLGYATNDVVFFGGLHPASLSTLDSQDSNIAVISAFNTDALKPFEDNLQNTESGVLNQKMGYFEVPLELSYAVIDQKFGLNIIGGFSTLFLNENAVSVQSAQTTMSLGKADNLNNIHFSSNVGLGFKYKIFKQLEAHFEPTLKYQFNTFSRDAGNFKPYFVGLYTGVSYKF